MTWESLVHRFISLADCNLARFKSLTVDKEGELARYKEYAEKLRPMVIESVSYMHKAVKEGKTVLVEGANAAMLDIDFGKPIAFDIVALVK